MRHKFDIQFFGGGSDVKSYSTHAEMPEDLKSMRQGLYDAIYPTIQNFSGDEWNRAKQISNNAINQQQNLLGTLPDLYKKNSNLVGKIENTVDTGVIPTALTNNLSSVVNKGLQSGMGSMLTNLGNRGVINSSITSKGINNLASNAADAYQRGYNDLFNSVINGYGTALSGSQGNVASVLNGANAYGNLGSTAYENAAAPLTAAFSLYKIMQNSHDTSNTQDTVVKEKSKF